MQSLDRILVATSFSERAGDALRKAAVLAAERDSGLTLLHVVEPVKRLRLRRESNQQMLLEARVHRARKELAWFAGEIAAKQGVPVEFRIDVGERVASILAACSGADVLFVGGTPSGWWPGAFQKTTAERLVGRCDIPIVVVHGPDSLQYGRALVPVGGSADDAHALRAVASLWPTAQTTVVRERRLSRDDASPSVEAGRSADVLVLTKHQALPGADFALRGIARRLLRSCACDVLVVPAGSLPSPRAEAVVRTAVRRGVQPSPARNAAAP